MVDRSCDGCPRGVSNHCPIRLDQVLAQDGQQSTCHTTTRFTADRINKLITFNWEVNERC